MSVWRKVQVERPRVWVSGGHSVWDGFGGLVVLEFFIRDLKSSHTRQGGVIVCHAGGLKKLVIVNI